MIIELGTYQSRIDDRGTVPKLVSLAFPFTWDGAFVDLFGLRMRQNCMNMKALWDANIVFFMFQEKEILKKKEIYINIFLGHLKFKNLSLSPWKDPIEM